MIYLYKINNEQVDINTASVYLWWAISSILSQAVFLVIVICTDHIIDLHKNAQKTEYMRFNKKDTTPYLIVVL